MALIIRTDQIPAVPPGIGTPLKALHAEQVVELDEAVATNPFSWLWIEVKKGILQHAGIFEKSGGRVLRPRKMTAA